VVRGGHFLSIETMHLTEPARQFDQLWPMGFTNNTHISASISIARILLLLIDEVNGRKYKKKL
jgi:hypothetical protein